MIKSSLYLPAESITPTSSGKVVHQFQIVEITAFKYLKRKLEVKSRVDSPAQNNQQRTIQITISFRHSFSNSHYVQFRSFCERKRSSCCDVISSKLSTTAKVSRRCRRCSRHYFSCRIKPIRSQLFSIVRRKAKREQKRLSTKISARSLQCSSNWSGPRPVEDEFQLRKRFVDCALEPVRRWNSF